MLRAPPRSSGKRRPSGCGNEDDDDHNRGAAARTAVEEEYTSSCIPTGHATVRHIKASAPKLSVRVPEIVLEHPEDSREEVQDPPPAVKGRWTVRTCNFNETPALFLQPTAQVMADFKRREKTYLDAIFAQETHHSTGLPCSCMANGPRLFRCIDCQHAPPYCSPCMVSSHQNLPFHRIQKWTGRYFERHSLFKLKFLLCLGHDGARCPQASDIDLKKELVVVHINGVHQLNVLFCACEPRAARPEQLLRSSLFPASWDKVETVFTFQLLKHHHLETLQSRTTSHDYWAMLRRLTDNTRPDGVPVSCLFRSFSILTRVGSLRGA